MLRFGSTFAVKSKNIARVVESLATHPNVAEHRMSELCTSTAIFIVVPGKILNFFPLHEFKDESLETWKLCEADEPETGALLHSVPRPSGRTELHDKLLERVLDSVRGTSEKFEFESICNFMVSFATFGGDLSSPPLFIVTRELIIGLGFSKINVRRTMNRMALFAFASVSVDEIAHRKTYEGRTIFNPIRGGSRDNTCLVMETWRFTEALVNTKHPSAKELSTFVHCFFYFFANTNFEAKNYGMMQKFERLNAEKNAIIEEKEAEIDDCKAIIEEKEIAIREKENDIENCKATIEDNEIVIREKETEIENCKATIREKEDEIELARQDIDESRERHERSVVGAKRYRSGGVVLFVERVFRNTIPAGDARTPEQIVQENEGIKRMLRVLEISYPKEEDENKEFEFHYLCYGSTDRHGSFHQSLRETLDRSERAHPGIVAVGIVAGCDSTKTVRDEMIDKMKFTPRRGDGHSHALVGRLDPAEVLRNIQCSIGKRVSTLTRVGSNLWMSDGHVVEIASRRGTPRFKLQRAPRQTTGTLWRGRKEKFDRANRGHHLFYANIGPNSNFSSRRGTPRFR